MTFGVAGCTGVAGFSIGAGALSRLFTGSSPDKTLAHSSFEGDLRSSAQLSR